MAGHRDPLRDLPDLHALLDVVEVMFTENMTSDQLNDWNRQVYEEIWSTPRRSTSTAETAEAVPPGFSVEEQQAAFGNFMAFAAGME